MTYHVGSAGGRLGVSEWRCSVVLGNRKEIALVYDQIDSLYVAPLEETYLPNWLYFPNCSFQGETIQSDEKSTLKGRSWTNKPATLDFSQLVDTLVIVKNMIYGFVSKSHIRSI